MGFGEFSMASLIQFIYDDVGSKNSEEKLHLGGYGPQNVETFFDLNTRVIS